MPLREESSAVLLDTCSGVAPPLRSSCSLWDSACSCGKAFIRAPARRRQGALGALYDNAPHTRSSILTFRERRRAPPSFVGRLPEAEVPENSPIASSPVVPISKALFPGERFCAFRI